MKSSHLLYPLFLLLFIASCKSNTKDESSAGSTEAQGQPTGTPYQLDSARCEIKWTAFKPTGAHWGVFPVSGGTIYVANELITGGNIEINMAGLEVRDLEGEDKMNLETHLKGTNPGEEEDFFNVNKFPKANYRILTSQRLENDPLGTHLIKGELTIKGITKPLDIKAWVDMANPNAIKAMTEPFVIDRTLWDIRFQSKKFFSDLQDDFIHDEVKMEITLGAIRANG